MQKNASLTRRVLGLAVAGVASALVAPGIASATAVNDSYTAPLASNSVNLGSYHVSGEVSLTSTFLELDVTSKANWTGSLPTVVGWNTSNVRQGADLAVGRTAVLPMGTLHVTWTLNGWTMTAAVDRDIHETVTRDATCMPQLLGSAYDCTVDTGNLVLVRTPLVPGSPYIKFSIPTRFTITPEGAIVTRKLTVGGTAAGTLGGLPVSLAPNSETVSLPCGPVGSSVGYKLSPFHWTPAVSASQQPTLHVGMLDPVLGLTELPEMSTRKVGPAIKASPAFDLTGAGETTNLGPLLPNSVPPTIAPIAAKTGKVGIPVYLVADTTSRCDVNSYVWHFSNGTTSYGPNPVRTFTEAGAVDGQVTVTDDSGLTATRSFALTISK